MLTSNEFDLVKRQLKLIYEIATRTNLAVEHKLNQISIISAATGDKLNQIEIEKEERNV